MCLIARFIHSFIEDFLIFKRTQLAEHLQHLNSNKKNYNCHTENRFRVRWRKVHIIRKACLTNSINFLLTKFQLLYICVLTKSYSLERLTRYLQTTCFPAENIDLVSFLATFWKWMCVKVISEMSLHQRYQSFFYKTFFRRRSLDFPVVYF